MTDDGSADSSSGSPSKQNKPTRSGDGEVNQRSVTSRWARLPAGLRRARRAFVPLFTMGFLVVVLVAFSSILLPFIFACMLVYLMEPLVSWMSQPKRGRRGLPRWASVVLVYIGFLTIVSTSLILVVPRFVTEIVRFAESSPEAVADFRKERLPGLNEQLHEFLSSYLPMDAEPLDIVPARDVVREARIKAVGVAAAMGGAQASVAAASQAEVQWDLQGEPGQLTRTYIGRVPEAALEAIPSPDAITSHGEWGVVKTEELPALKLHPDGRGGYEIYWNDDVLEVVARGEKGWIVRRHAEDEDSLERARGLDLTTIFDLERTFDDIVEGWIMSGREQLSSVVDFAQSLTVRLIQIFLAIVLTLMVAAFLSIDLPRFKSFARGMVPDDYQPSYDELIRRMDIGLGGVVRGQLMICIVNGVLTYIGLAFLGVKYSMLLAVIAAVMSIIPIFGAFLSTIPIVAIALTQSFTLGLLTLGWILIINFVEANFLNPKIIGTAAHIHPVIVIFALLAGQSAFGLVGAILAIPVASLVLTLFVFVRDKYSRNDPDGLGETREVVSVDG